MAGLRDLNNVSLKKKKKKRQLSKSHKKWSYQSVFLSPSQYNIKLFLQVHNLKLIDKPGKYDRVFNMC